MPRQPEVELRRRAVLLHAAPGRFTVAAVIAVAAAVLTFGAASGSGSGGTARAADESAHAWCVQLPGAPLAKGGNHVIGRTSMASPHVAGAAALLLAARGTMTPAEVRQALLNTGTPFASILAAGRADSTARQGAGLLTVVNALKAPVSASPAKLSLGQGHGGTRTITLTNAGTSAVTYTSSSTSAVTVDPEGGTYPFTFGMFFFPNTVTFSSPTPIQGAVGPASR